MLRSDQCHFCEGEVRPIARPGRWHDYRGVQCEVPPDLAISTCQACGREWMSDADVTLLSESFEQQRLAAEFVREAPPISARSSRPAIALLAAAALAPFAGIHLISGEAEVPDQLVVQVMSATSRMRPVLATFGAPSGPVATTTHSAAALVNADASGDPS